MMRPLDALPLLELTAEDARLGRVATLQARASARDGPVVHATVPTPHLAGRCACLVGRDALAFAFGSGREHLSSARAWLPLLGRRYGQAVLNRDDPQHLDERRAWSPAFTTAYLAQRVATIDALIVRRIERWRAGGAIDAYGAARELAFAAVACALAGFDDDEDTATLGRLFADVLAPPQEREDLASHHERMRPTRDAIERRLLDHLAALHGRRASEPLSLPALLLREFPTLPTEALLPHLNILLVAGHETATSLLAWSLLLLAERPEWCDRLEREGAVHRIARPLAEEPETPALDAFVTETGRLHPPLLNAPRIASRDFDYAGVRIAAGTTVTLAIGATHRIASDYPQPDVFEPRRFLAGEFATRDPDPLTFGRGSRTCLGMRFAQITLKLALTRLLAVARLQRTDETPCVHAGFWNARPRGPLALRIVSAR